jgi:hypothetical protein
MNGGDTTAKTIGHIPGLVLMVQRIEGVSVDARLYADLLSYLRVFVSSHDDPALTCPVAQNLLDRLALRGRLSGVYF